MSIARGKKYFFLSLPFVVLLLLVIVSSIVFSSPVPEMNTNERGGKGVGGAAVPVSSIEILETTKTFNSKPGKMMFDLDNESYFIQIRRIYDNRTEFIFGSVGIDSKSQSIVFSNNEENRIDLNFDGVDDIVLKLNNMKRVNSFNEKNSDLKSTEFSVKLIEGKI